MEIRIAYSNATDPGGTFVTPVWFGIHDAGFDIFDVGEPASEGLERIAEDGTFEAIAAELAAADPEGQGGVVTGPAIPPIGPRETGSATVVVDDTAATPLVSFAAMVLPSNDAFVGSSDPLTVFDANGNFLGEQNIVLTGNEIYDAGTEVNTELDAAFLNQDDPDTGIDQGGVIQRHPGFIGSVQNPASEFGQNILGGTTVVGAVIDPVAGDFTADRDAPVGVFHVNEVERFSGSNFFDIYFGGDEDDLVEGLGGIDILFGGGGWDVIDGGHGADIIGGGSGADILNGGNGLDIVRGGAGDDTVMGGNNEDIVIGNRGDDIIVGGAGNDIVRGGRGEDIFVVTQDADIDLVRDFVIGEDRVDLSAFDVAFEDLSLEDGRLSNGRRGTTVDLDTATVELLRVSSADLGAEDFIFA